MRKMFYDYITDFIFVEDVPRQADIIFLPGGNYPEAAIHAASLYQAGYAPLIMPSGKYSVLKGYFEPESKPEWLRGESFSSECDFLSRILYQLNVPAEAVVGEDQATYTYENAICSRKKTEELGLHIRRAIISCQAFHARRCLLYYQEQFPKTEFLVCPVVTKGISRTFWHRTEYGIETVLGEVERCGAQFHEIMKQYL